VTRMARTRTVTRARTRSGSARAAPGLALLAALALAPLAACDSGGGPSADVPAAGDLPSDGWSGDAVPDPGGKVPDGATEAQVQALAAVNAYRAASGLAPVDEISTLNAAAQAHADCIVGNCVAYGSSGTSPHDENPAWPGFTGEDSLDRITVAGYRLNGGVGEVIAFEGTPDAAVTGWIDTLYHRIPLLDPNARQLGFGTASLPDDQACAYPYRNADVMEVVSVYPGFEGTALYPPDGARLIPTSFWGREVPQPPRPPAGWPSGSVVTVHFGTDKPFRVTGHCIVANGDDLQHYIMAATEDREAGVAADPYLHDHRVLALYTLSRLAAGTDHTVVLDLERDGAPLHLEWSFRTAYKAND
jgi:uncharacterized protein YkwD